MSIYHLKDGVWADYVEEQEGILVYKDGEWVEGSANLDSPDISVYTYNNGKFIRKYPNAHITYTDVFTASGAKYTHNKTSSAWSAGTTESLKIGACAIGGIYESGAIYTGWLGYNSPTLSVPKGTVDQILSVDVYYRRRGVGNWENEYPIPLVLSTLKSATGSGTNAHNSKCLNTFYSDTNMLACTKTNENVPGNTTMNNENAKEMIKTWMNSSGYSILLGYKESTNTPYVGLYGIRLTITYTCKVSRAIFTDIPGVYNNVKRNKDGNVEMWLYDNELDLSYDEIMKNRRNRAIRDIEETDVIFN